MDRQEVFVSQVEKEPSGTNHLWLKVTSEGSGDERKIHILVADRDNQKSWKTAITSADAAKASRLYGLCVEEYWKIMLEELRSCSANYLFSVRDEKFRIEKLSSSQLKLVYADLEMKNLPFAESMCEISELLMDSQITLQKENEQLKLSLAQISEDRDILQQQQERFTNDTVLKEEAMLENFLLLLNAKKKEIQRLKETGNDQDVAQGSPNTDYDADTDIEEDAMQTESTDERQNERRQAAPTASDFADVMDL